MKIESEYCDERIGCIEIAEGEKRKIRVIKSGQRWTLDLGQLKEIADSGICDQCHVFADDIEAALFALIELGYVEIEEVER